MVFGDTDAAFLLTQALSRKTAGLSPCDIHVFLEIIILHVAMTVHFALVCPPKKNAVFFMFFFCSQSLCRTLWTNRAGYNRGVVKKFAVAELREDRQTYGLPCGRNRGRYERSQARETKKPDEIPGVARLKHMGPKETGKFGKITPFQSFTCRVSSSFLGCVFFLQ